MNMQKIDLISNADCEPDIGPDPKAEHPATWANMATKEFPLGEFPCDAIHEVAINPRILELAPRNSSIVDLGGGIRIRPLDQNILRQNNQQLINVDFVWPTQGALLDTVQVYADLRRIPSRFCDATSLDNALPLYDQLLESLERMSNTPAHISSMRAELRLLLQVVQRHPIGLMIVSNILPYMGPEAREKLLRFAAVNLMPGGILLFSSRGKFTAQHGKGYKDDERDIFTLLRSRQDMEKLEDSLLAPVMTPEQIRSVAAACGEDPFEPNREVRRRIRAKEVSLVAHNASMDRKDLQFYNWPNGRISLFDLAERLIILKKK